MRSGSRPSPCSRCVRRSLGIFRAELERPISAMRTRLHGDFHLGQVLWTGRDFVFVDFEGEPARPISTRRIKRSPLRDVAGMIRSFQYAAHQGLTHVVAVGTDEHRALAGWADYWYVWASSAFLRSYLRTVEGAPFIPAERDPRAGLLNVFLLEKAIYELGYELNNRPEWVRLPMYGIRHLVDTAASS